MALHLNTQDLILLYLFNNMKENVQRAVFKQSVKKTLVQFRARADNLNADV